LQPHPFRPREQKRYHPEICTGITSLFFGTEKNGRFCERMAHSANMTRPTEAAQDRLPVTTGSTSYLPPHRLPDQEWTDYEIV
jgi:hypothetical protein